MSSCILNFFLSHTDKLTEKVGIMVCNFYLPHKEIKPKMIKKIKKKILSASNANPMEDEMITDCSEVRKVFYNSVPPRKQSSYTDNFEEWRLFPVDHKTLHYQNLNLLDW